MTEKRLSLSTGAYTKDHKEFYRHILTGIERLNKEEIEEDTSEMLNSTTPVLPSIDNTLHILIPTHHQ